MASELASLDESITITCGGVGCKEITTFRSLESLERQPWYLDDCWMCADCIQQEIEDMCRCPFRCVTHHRDDF